MAWGPVFAGTTNRAVVVSAPRLDNLDLMAVNTAADVTVIDRATVEQSGSLSVPDLLQKEANVLVRSSSGNGNDGQISMRGFGDNSHLRVLVLVDGHKVNRPDMGGIEWQAIPLSNVERIEVLRGGQTVLYGNHALSGVVKVTTKRSEGEALRSHAEMGSYGYRSGAFEYDNAAGDFDFRMGAHANAYDGFRSNSATRASNVNGTVGWYPNDTDVITFRWSTGQSRTEFPGSLDYAEMKNDPSQSANEDDSSENWNSLATLLYETERDWGAGRLNSGVSYRRREVDYSSFDTFYDNDQLGLSLGPRVRLGDENTFVLVGADLAYDDLRVDRYFSQARMDVLAEGKFNRMAAAPYIFAQKTVAKKMVFSGGARFEYAGTDNLYTEYVREQVPAMIDTIFGPRPNPDYKNPPDVRDDVSYDGFVDKQGWAAELSVSRELSDELRVWGGYDRVYRYPTLDEVAAYQGYPLSDPLNENLDPETGNNFEVGVRYEGSQWTWSLAGYYLGMDDEIAFSEYTDSTTGQLIRLNENIGSTRRLGTDVELAVNRSWYGGSTRWSLVDARMRGGEEEGNRVPLVPWAHGTTTVWVYLSPEIKFSALHTVVSEQYQGNDEENQLRKMDAYSLLGLRMNVALTEHADLTVMMDNVLDEQYASSAYSGGFYPSIGRSFRVNLKVEF